MSPTLGPFDDVVAAVGHVPTRLAVTDASLADRVAARLDLPRLALGLSAAGRTPTASAVDAATAVLAQDTWVVDLDAPAAVPLVGRRAEVVVRVDLPASGRLHLPGRTRDPRRLLGRRLDRLDRMDRLGAAGVRAPVVVLLRGHEDSHTWLEHLPRAA